MIQILAILLIRKLVVSVYTRTRAVHVLRTDGQARWLGGVGAVMNSPRARLTELMSAEFPGTASWAY